VEAVRAHARKTDFKPLTFQIRLLIKKNWVWTGTYFANAQDQRRAGTWA
jgi:hypothetical protein